MRLVSQLVVNKRLSILVAFFVFCPGLTRGQEYFPEEDLPDFYDQCGKIEEVPGDTRTKIPWVAAIYRRDNVNSPFRFLVTGTIISSSTILSLFGGAFGALPRESKGKYSLDNPINLIVGVGMKTTNFADNDRYSQLLPVQHIIPYRGHNPENLEYHFFILHLKNKIDLKTPYARAICIPPTEYGATVSAYDGWPIDVGGFASPRNANGAYELKIFSMQTGNFEYCSNTFDFHYRSIGNITHVFCSRLRISENSRFEDINQNSCILHGSAQFTGVDTSSGPKFFTGGIVSLIPSKKRGICNSNTTYFIANALIHLDWIFKNVKCGSQKIACSDGKCIPLYKICNLQKDCDDNWDEDPIYCQSVYSCPRNKEYESRLGGRAFHQCGLNGICINSTQICDGTPDCSDGSDELNYKCTKSKTNSQQLRIEDSAERKSCFLPPLSNGMEIECLTTTGNRIPCDSKAPSSGTRLIIKCSPHYISKFAYSSIEMLCEGGSWTPFKPFSCHPDCGTVDSESLRAYRLRSPIVPTRISFPWYASIFVYTDEGNYFKFKCGSTLIDKSVLVTSAQCLLDRDRSMKVDLGKFRIVLSPVSSFYVDNLADDSVQLFNISNIWFPPKFDLLKLQPDLALLKLDRPVIFGKFVRPACSLLPTFSKIPKIGHYGKIAGFGIDETNDLSSILQNSIIPVVSFKNCKRSLKNLVSLNNFCSGQTNETSLCRTDKGSGLVFPIKLGSITRFVLKGVISGGDYKNIQSCAFENYSLFTHLDSYSEWILDILEKIDRN